MLCRGSTFKPRFAQIKDCMFLYKHEKADMEPRYIIDLRKANISKGVLPTGMNYFSIITTDLDIKI